MDLVFVCEISMFCVILLTIISVTVCFVLEGEDIDGGLEPDNFSSSPVVIIKTGELTKYVPDDDLSQFDGQIVDSGITDNRPFNR